MERQTFDFDIGLSFMSALPLDEVKGYLRGRVAHLEHVLQYLGAHQAEELADEHVPNRLASAVFDHSRVHLQAELDWTRDLLQNVEQGAFDGEIEWMQGVFEGDWEAHD